MATENPRILIVGPGSMGLMHAGLLWRAGLDVSVLDHRPERARRLSHGGFSVSGAAGEFHARIPLSASATELGGCDIIIFLVKAYSTASAIEHCAGVVTDRSVMLTLQNGLGNLEMICDAFGHERVLAGTTSSGAYRTADDAVVIAAVGEITIGGADAETAAWVCSLLEAAALPVQVTDDVDSALWTKAIINAGVNPLGGLTRLRNGQLLQVPAVRSMMRRIVDEACRVARAEGVCIDEGMLQLVEDVATRTANNRCSMLQDLSAGRLTEIDYINGYIAACGGRLGYPAPANAVIRGLVAASQSKKGNTNQ